MTDIHGFEMWMEEVIRLGIHLQKGINDMDNLVVRAVANPEDETLNATVMYHDQMLPMEPLPYQELLAEYEEYVRTENKTSIRIDFPR